MLGFQILGITIRGFRFRSEVRVDMQRGSGIAMLVSVAKPLEI